jgi:poly-gamma-glutamate capsule biosynthesis protein CapA/YwtB (metallophosphatase superfamily)
MRRFVPVIIILLSACTSLASQEDQITLAFTGDILMHIAVKKSAELNAGPDRAATNDGFDFLFKRALSRLQSPDLLVGNMEFPVVHPFVQDGFVFNCPPGIMGALNSAGFDILVNANNHILDHGTRGLLSTLDYVQKAGMESLGVGRDERTARAGIVREIKGCRIGLYAATGLMNYEQGRKSRDKKYFINWLYEEETIRQDLSDLRQRCDILIFVFHTGSEYTTRPNTRDMNLLKRLAETGVDAMIGHHPHILQPYHEITKSDGSVCPVFMSLGNFISDQNMNIRIHGTKQHVNIRDSAIATLTIRNKKLESCGIIPVRTVKEHTVKSDGKPYRCIQVVPLDDLLSEARNAKNTRGVRDIEKSRESITTVLFGNRSFVYYMPELSGNQPRQVRR